MTEHNRQGDSDHVVSPCVPSLDIHHAGTAGDQQSYAADTRGLSWHTSSGLGTCGFATTPRLTSGLPAHYHHHHHHHRHVTSV